MSTYITGYAEAKMNGKWYCIDFFQYDEDGNLKHRPCIEGQGMIRHALEWDCSMEEISVPDDLSEKVRELCTGSDGNLLGSGENKWYSWHKIHGTWFGKADLDQPEFCGFFPTSELSYYLSNPDENWLNENNMISVQEYHASPDEERKAYRYYEYTNPSGSRRIIVFRNRLSQNINYLWRRNSFSGKCAKSLFTAL